MIGGASRDFPRPWQKADQEWCIIEGDEYDSAFFNKVPKFLHYRPHTVILTSVEFDHADIYPDLAAVVAAYEALMKIIPADGRLIAWGDCPLVRKVAQSCAAPVEFYGENNDNDWQFTGFSDEGLKSSFEHIGPEGFYARLSLPRPGVYKALNAAAGSAAYVGQGGDGRVLAQALGSLKGVKRRQEFLGNYNGVTVIDDFAHHPTAVSQTIEAVSRAFPAQRLIAVFEPRSNTSRRALFQDDYAQALARADRIFLRQTPEAGKAPSGDRLDIDRLAENLGPKASTGPDGLALAEEISRQCRPGDVVLVMSNGGFDGLVPSLPGLLSRKQQQ